MNTPLKEIVSLVEGTLLSGDAEFMLKGFNSIHEAQPGEVTFLGNAKYAAALKKSQASVVILEEAVADLPESMAVILVKNPTLQFSRVIEKFGPKKLQFAPGIHPSAVVAASAKYNPANVFIGPNAVISDDVVIGDGCVIHAGVVLGNEVQLGQNCVLHPNVVVRERCVLKDRVVIHPNTAIGTDGFGYEFSEGRHKKIDQVGIVLIESDVEIGSCTTIDRARFGKTVIGEGTKIDNLVQIAHNVVIGKHCVIVSQVGVAGSTHVGNYTTLAGQSGVSGHLKIGDQVTVLARAGVTSDLESKGIYTGFPAKPLMQGRRLMVAPTRIPSILSRLKELEEKLETLQNSKDAQP